MINKLLFLLLAIDVISCTDVQPYIQQAPNKYQVNNSNHRLGYSSAQEPFEKLKGDIKSIKVFKYNVYPDSLNLDEQLNLVEEFHINSEFLVYKKVYYRIHDNSKVITYYSDYEKAVIDSVIFYDDSGQIESRELSYYIGTNKIVRLGSLRFSDHEDKKSLKIDSVFSNDTLYLIKNFSKSAVYNNHVYWVKSANEQDVFAYYPNGKLKSETHYVDNNISLLESFTSKGYVDKREIYNYNADTLTRILIERFDIDDLGIMKSSSYQWVTYRDSGAVYYHDLEYNEYNQPIACYVTFKGDKKTFYLKEYNEYGDLIKTQESHDTIRHEYSNYDLYQNWGESISWKNNEPYQRVVREIEYYTKSKN